ncbi:MAG: alanine racemase [Planctomycetota bacterium]|jgi:alanine racemase
MYYHRVWSEIDLNAMDHNLEQIKKLLPEDREVMAVLKADAYGHGAVRIARHLQNQGVWGFGVGDSQEALELRGAGITRPVLILGAIIEDEIEKVVKNDLSVCVHSEKRIGLLAREAERQRKPCRVHVMIDTGMGRLGVFPDQALRLARKVHESRSLVLEGVCTHFSSTSSPNDPFTGSQEKRFLDVKRILDEAGLIPQVYHASNSGALLSSRPELLNLVRPGIALYGISPYPMILDDPALRPVMSLKTQIIYMKDVPEGTPISYNRLYTTPRATRIATLPIGYNDGYSYRLSNRGRVILHGKIAPVVGAVSMDYTMIDVGDIEGAEVGDHVTLIGEDSGERIRVEEVAALAGTIPYEIVCGIGKRVRRVALDGTERLEAGERIPAAARNKTGEKPGLEASASQS